MKPTIPALTGLRFFAALCVVLSHYRLLIPYPPPLGGFLSHGEAGVVLFFVLSGFVLAYNYAAVFQSGLDGYSAFLWARLARIGPTYWLSLLAVTPLTLGAAGAVTVPLVASWLLNATALHAFWPHALSFLWNLPAWSLSAEVLFYTLLPALLRYALWPLARRFSLVTLLLLAYGLGALSAVAGRLAFGGGPGSAYFPPVYLWLFLLGSLLALGYLDSASFVGALRASRRLREALLFASLAGWLALVADLLPATPLTYALPLFGLIAALACGETAAGRLLASRPLLLLGEASYSLYLAHWPILFALLLAFGVDPAPVAPIWWAAKPATLPAPLALLALLSAIALSIVLYLYVERPARRWLRARPWLKSPSSARPSTN